MPQFPEHKKGRTRIKMKCTPIVRKNNWRCTFSYIGHTEIMCLESKKATDKNKSMKKHAHNYFSTPHGEVEKSIECMF